MSRVITVDGPAGSGKGTVTKLVAKELNFYAMDTGTIYRSIALHCRRNNIAETDIELLKKELEKIDFKYIDNDGKVTIIFNGEDVTGLLRTPEIDKYASIYSQIFEVRECARRIQREFAREHDCIFEGRAMGSVDFPDAFLKIYLDATPEERARRRLKQNEEKGIESPSFEEILKEIKDRDYRDSHRDIEVLKVPDGGIVVDSTNMTIDEVVERIVSLAKERM